MDYANTPRSLSLPATLVIGLLLWAGVALIAPNASAGPDCTLLGGSCKSSCSGSEDYLGHVDCGISSECCKPAPVTAPVVEEAPVGGLPTPPKGSMSDPSGRNSGVTLDNPAFKPLGDTSVQGIIGRVIKFILGLTGVVALVMVTYGGLTWMTSAGSSEKVERAKKTVLWSVLGIIIIFSAYALVDFVLSAVS